MKRAILPAFAGVMTALSVVLLQLGAVIWIFAYVMPLLCGVLMIAVTESAGKRSAWLVYAAVSLLAMLLETDRESALLYTLFFGYYPLVRECIDKLSSKAVRAALKLLVFNAGVVAAELLATYVFGIPFDDFLGKWGAVILLALGNLMFVIYERLLGILKTLYIRKLKPRLDKYLR